MINCAKQSILTRSNNRIASSLRSSQGRGKKAFA
jgi:hypothetical protein